MFSPYVWCTLVTIVHLLSSLSRFSFFAKGINGRIEQKPASSRARLTEDVKIRDVCKDADVGPSGDGDNLSAVPEVRLHSEVL